MAWRFKTENLGPKPEYNFQSTPLMVGGVLYTTAGSRRAVVAIDAGTGEQLWIHREEEGAPAPGAFALERDPFLLETSVPGVFAAGDVRYGTNHRVASAVGEGAIAYALMKEYLRGL